MLNSAEEYLKEHRVIFIYFTQGVKLVNMVQLTAAAPVDAITTLFCFQNASFSIYSHSKVAVYNNNFNIFFPQATYKSQVFHYSQCYTIPTGINDN